MTLYNNGLFIFTRDFRVNDNNGLNATISSCRHVYTAFFFTPEQVSSSNKYKSSNAIRFMIESLDSLSEEIRNKGGRLITLYGKPEDCLQTLFTRLDIDAVFINKDVTKYAKARASALQHVATEYTKPFVELDDFYLSSPGSVANTSGGRYSKFTPYYNKVTSMLKSKHLVIERPSTPRKFKFAKTTVNFTTNKVKQIALRDAMTKFTTRTGYGGLSPNPAVIGGRANALNKLKTIDRRVPDYEATRNDLSDKTTLLSAHIKFGNVSIREVYYAFREKLDGEASSSLIRQLFWRDFYAQLMDETPSLLTKPMRSQYGSIRWSSSKRLLDAWKEGNTGFPIVDAGMRELAKTGYMHNRARLICGSFLPKTLFVNWQEGEGHFARSLIDYDPASNNGNWQWVAGTGSDSQPYFRILNPFSQSQKYDPDAAYIYKWVPELRDVPTRDIHKWDTTYKDYPDVDYPAPIVSYSEQKDKVLAAYKSAGSSGK